MTNNFEDETNSARQLTVRSPSKDMRAHALAFLAKQNGQTWMEDEQYTYNRLKISDIITECSMEAGFKIGNIKSIGKRVAKLMRASGGRIKLSAAHDLIANALGYKNYARALELRGVDDFVPNLWPLEAPRGLQLLSVDSDWPSEVPCAEFAQRQAFNERRAPARKLTAIQEKRKKTIARIARRAAGELSD
ncbi:hypothetical protein [Pseudomonas fluorescens group sp. PF-69]